MDNLAPPYLSSLIHTATPSLSSASSLHLSVPFARLKTMRRSGTLYHLTSKALILFLTANLDSKPICSILPILYLVFLNSCK